MRGGQHDTTEKDQKRSMRQFTVRCGERNNEWGKMKYEETPNK